jgi:hypothetical protein
MSGHGRGHTSWASGIGIIGFHTMMPLPVVTGLLPTLVLCPSLSLLVPAGRRLVMLRDRTAPGLTDLLALSRRGPILPAVPSFPLFFDLCPLFIPSLRGRPGRLPRQIGFCPTVSVRLIRPISANPVGPSLPTRTAPTTNAPVARSFRACVTPRTVIFHLPNHRAGQSSTRPLRRRAINGGGPVAVCSSSRVSILSGSGSVPTVRGDGVPLSTLDSHRRPVVALPRLPHPVGGNAEEPVNPCPKTKGSAKAPDNNGDDAEESAEASPKTKKKRVHVYTKAPSGGPDHRHAIQTRKTKLGFQGRGPGRRCGPLYPCAGIKTLEETLDFGVVLPPDKVRQLTQSSPLPTKFAS